MGDKTGIEWTDATWNPLAGCSLVSPGCTNCYAMKQAARLLDKPGSHYEGTTKRVNGNAAWTGKVALAPDHILMQPLKWRRSRRIFVNSMSDLFHEDVPDEWIDQIFAIMALCPQHVFQVLTKRPERMRAYCTSLGHHHEIDRVSLAAKAMNADRGFYWDLGNIGWQLPNVWLGVSIEDQKRAEERIPLLLQTPAAVRFLSCEPLLGPVDLRGIWNHCPEHDFAGGFCLQRRHEGVNWIDWVIAGGESGSNARPVHPDWVRSLRDQCQTTGVAFHFKQWGEWHPDALAYTKAVTGECPPPNMKIGKRKSGRVLDGRTWDQFPETRVA